MTAATPLVVPSTARTSGPTLRADVAVLAHRRSRVIGALSAATTEACLTADTAVAAVAIEGVVGDVTAAGRVNARPDVDEPRAAQRLPGVDCRPAALYTCKTECNI